MVTNCGARKCFFGLILQLPSYTNCLIYKEKLIRVRSATLKITAGKENSRFNNVTDCTKFYVEKVLIPRSTGAGAHGRTHPLFRPVLRFTVNWTSTCQSIRGTSKNLLRVALSHCDAHCTFVQLRFSCDIAAARDSFSRPPTALRSIPCRKKYSSRPSVAK
jgi:hypothetical protein